MSIQTEINARTAKLQAILADANESIAAKNGTEAVDLKSLPEAIDGIPAGDVNLQVKAVTPTGKIITVRPDSGYDGLSAVNVAGDAYLVPENIADGVTIYGVTGTLEAEVPVMQYKSVTPTGEYITVEPDSGYDGLGAEIVEGDGALVPENIVKDVTIYGVTGTYECEGGSAMPEPYASYIEEAKAVYTGEYANVIYAEGYGKDTGVTYHTVMFLLDSWAISAYDAATTEYTHSGFYMVQKEDDGEWTLTDYTSTTADEHYAKNIKAASLYIEYEGMTLFPVGINSYPDTTAIDYSTWDSGSFSETLETGDTLTYNVEFTDGQPTKITAPDGTVTAITWEASE